MAAPCRGKRDALASLRVPHRHFSQPLQRHGERLSFCVRLPSGGRDKTRHFLLVPWVEQRVNQGIKKCQIFRFSPYIQCEWIMSLAKCVASAKNENKQRKEMNYEK